MVAVRKRSRTGWLPSRGKLHRSFAAWVALYDAAHNWNSKVTEVVDAAKEVQSKPWILQLMNSANYTEKTESWIKKLDQHINDFSVGST